MAERVLSTENFARGVMFSFMCFVELLETVRVSRPVFERVKLIWNFVFANF